MAKKLSYRTQELLSNLSGVPESCFSEIESFKEFLISLRDIASKKTHYHNLNEWSDKAYGFVHNKLNEHGFKSGEPEVNAKNPGARFWWNVYGILSNVTYSIHLKTEVSSHHSSAYERNEALIMELEDALEFSKSNDLTKPAIFGKYNYDVFYEEAGYEITGSTVGDNKAHAIENFKKVYGTNAKIKHLQKLSWKN